MDNFDYKKYLAEGKLLKESVNENVPDDGDVYGWYWPIADKAIEMLKKDSKYSESSLGAVGSGDGSTYISITVDFPSGSEEHFDVFFDGEEGNEQVTNIESTFVSEGSKPDFIDIDGDGDKKESMKKAAKDKEATVDEDINYDVFDEKPIDFKSLLELGIKSSLLMGEDELMEISDAFEERGDEQSDRIASHLNSAIELMQNGYSKAAAPNLRRFQAACREALNELKKSVDEGLEKNNKVLVKLLKEYSEDYIVVYDKTLKKVIKKFINNKDGYYSGRSKARRFVDDMVKSDGDIEKQNYEIGKETEYRSMEESVDEGPGQKHYTKDGKEWKGATHKMPDGTLMTQDPHNKDSEKLSHKSVDESESFFTGHVDQIAQAEFGMDYDQLGRGEKEWVRDEIDNMTFGEGDEPEKILTSRNKLEQTLNDISDELTDDQLDTISSMIVDLSSKIKKTLKK